MWTDSWDDLVCTYVSYANVSSSQLASSVLVLWPRLLLLATAIPVLSSGNRGARNRLRVRVRYRGNGVARRFLLNEPVSAAPEACRLSGEEGLLVRG